MTANRLASFLSGGQFRHQRLEHLVDGVTLEAELLQGQGGVSGRARRLGGAGRGEYASGAVRGQFVAQLHDQALGGSSADSADPRKRFDVAGRDGGAENRHRHGAEDIQCQFPADSGDVDQLSEKFLLLRRCESEKGDGVLADLRLDVQRRLAAGLRQLIEGGERNRHLVSDAVDIQNAAGKVAFRHDAAEQRDHFSTSMSSEISAALTE